MLRQFLDMFPLESDASPTAFAYLRAVEVAADGDTIVLTIDSDERRWRIRCTGVQAERSGGEPRLRCVEEAFEFSSAALHTDHPLLWPWNREHLQVYFGAAPQDSNRLIIDLVAAHETLVGVDLPFTRFINAPSITRLQALLSSGSGCLALAPSPIAHAYCRVLSAHSCRPSLATLLGGPIPDGTRPEQTCAYKLLTLGVGSYVIAEAFRARSARLRGGA